MSKKLIELHKEWSEKGRLPNFGLCTVVPESYEKAFDLLLPTDDDYFEIEKQRHATTYWGSGLNQSSVDRFNKYTPLRQTIVLLICAMRKEI